MRLRKRHIRAIAISVAALLGVALVAWVFRTPLLRLIPTPPVVVTVLDNGREINLLQGQRLEIRLPVNSYSGDRWHLGVPLPFLEEGDSTFTQSSLPTKAGDGLQATTFTAVSAGNGPLFMSLLPESDQNSLEPSMSFRIVVIVH